MMYNKTLNTLLSAMLSPISTREVHFVHPLAYELDGQFEHNINQEVNAGLKKHDLAEDNDFCRAMSKSVTSMVVASQQAEMNHLYSYGLTNSSTVHAPSEEAYTNYVEKVIFEDTVGEGLSWLAQKALQTYYQVYRGKRYAPSQKGTFEGGAIMNNGHLTTTERLDRVIANLPHLLQRTGVDIADVHTFDREAPDTHIRHRIWPIEQSIDETIAFYADHVSTRHYTLRRRRPTHDVLFKMTDDSGKQQLLLGEAYKESFAIVTPSLFSAEYRLPFDRAFAAHSISDILKKSSAVAEICGEAFRTVIDARDETTPAVVPTYTCLMFRFTNPYAATLSTSPLSPDV